MMGEDPGLFHTLYSTRALRRFKPDSIPDEVLFQLLDVAIRAPSGQNAQDWRFIIVRSREALKRMMLWSQGPWQRYQARFEDQLVWSCHLGGYGSVVHCCEHHRCDSWKRKRGNLRRG